ncbi:uncharacterized protein LOC143280656 [Babylonia areolata]|uniref:uncharacterized protein LOC143280656 n=1 Tax=Babylonia areolata TaxID=304850 RepID=UPI003FD6B997
MNDVAHTSPNVGPGLTVTMETLAAATNQQPAGSSGTSQGALSLLVPPGCLLLEQSDFVPWDNPDNIISRQADYWVSTILIGTIVLPVLFVVGVVGNVVSAAVFWRQGLRDRINLVLFTLSLADLLVLLSNFCLTAEKVYRDLVGFSGFFITYFPGLTGVTWVSQFLSAVIASERCFCVVSPFHAQKFFKTSTMAAVIFSTSAVLLAGMLAIAGPKHTAVCMFDPLTNTTKDIVYVTDYYLDNKEILDLFDVFLYATTLPALFLVVVAVTTAVTAIKLRQALAWRQETAGTGTAASQDKDNKASMLTKEAALTRMLIATSVLFIVCLVPILLVQIATFLVPDLNYDGRYHNLTSVLWQCINSFRCLNSALNFFIYLRMGSKFRQTLTEMLASCGPCFASKQ